MESTTYHARTDELVVQDLGDELLIYDRRSDVAHCLGSAAAAVWRGCEGGATETQLVDALPADTEGDRHELVAVALAELADKELLEVSHVELVGITRRKAVRRLAGVGAATLAAPLIVSATAQPAFAGYAGTCATLGQSCASATCCPGLSCSGAGTTCCTSNGGSCTTNGQCCSGVCAGAPGAKMCAP